jgi:hypothetical protein
MNDAEKLKKSWEKKTEKDVESPNYTQLCVWPGTGLGDGTPERFELFMEESFGVKIKFMEEVTTLPGQGGEGGRKDLFFYVHNNDLGKFAVPRLGAGIRWWEDVVANNSHTIYPKEIIDKYKVTW